MAKHKHYLLHKDHAADELLAALLKQPAYLFNDLFLVVYESLKARKVANLNQDMLRFRVYERLQTFVAEGLVTKTGKSYSGLQPALQARFGQMANARAVQEERKKAKLGALTPPDAPAEVPP